MAKSRNILLQELHASVRSAGDGEKTSAQDLVTFLTSLVDELLDRTEAPAIPTTGLLGWWRADQGVSRDAAGNLSKWDDQSGQDRALFPEPGFAPLTTAAWAGGQAVVFEGQQLFALLDLGLPEPPSVVTLVLVMQKKAGVSAIPASFDHDLNLWASDGIFAVNTWGNDFTGVSGEEAVLNVPIVVTTELASRRPADLRVWFNGQAQVVSPLVNVPSPNALEFVFRLGGNVQLGRGSYFWQGWIGEALLYDRVLSATEHTHLAAALAQRYTLG